MFPNPEGIPPHYFIGPFSMIHGLIIQQLHFLPTGEPQDVDRKCGTPEYLGIHQPKNLGQAGRGYFREQPSLASDHMLGLPCLDFCWARGCHSKADAGLLFISPCFMVSIYALNHKILYSKLREYKISEIRRGLNY